jgi:cyclic di-GMP phosphodiesterase
MTPVQSGQAPESKLSDRELRQLATLSTGIARALINAMEAKSPYLRGHSERVAAMSATIAAELQLDDDAIEQIRLAGRLHDVGKIGIREEVLNKPGTLTPEEVAHVHDHVRIAMDILAPLAHLGPVIDFVRDHQERRDGSGYPRGLRGDAISLGGRIIGAADSFDAVTSPRVYRKRKSSQEALDYFRQSGEAAMDPTVLAALTRVVSSGHALTFLDDDSPAGAPPQRH